jgi:hypothetical protein
LPHYHQEDVVAEQKRSHRITVKEAEQLLHRHRAASEEHGGHFHKEDIERLLKQPGCTGLRFYYGTHHDGKRALVLVGVGENNTDLYDGEILDNHYPCPPWCAAEGPLVR